MSHISMQIEDWCRGMPKHVIWCVIYYLQPPPPVTATAAGHQATVMHMSSPRKWEELGLWTMGGATDNMWAVRGVDSVITCQLSMGRENISSIFPHGGEFVLMCMILHANDLENEIGGFHMPLTPELMQMMCIPKACWNWNTIVNVFKLVGDSMGSIPTSPAPIPTPVIMTHKAEAYSTAQIISALNPWTARLWRR